MGVNRFRLFVPLKGKSMRLWILMLSALFLVSIEKGHAQDGQYEALGQIGGGIFRPTGSDGDVAGTSLAIQLIAAVGFSK